MKLKTLGVVLIALLAGSSFVFTVALLIVENQFDAAQQSINSVYLKSVLPLQEIDANTKNLRFQLYASFMHNKQLDVSVLHDHPISIHFNIIEAEIKKNQMLWEELKTRPEIPETDLRELRGLYDTFYRDDITPAFTAAKNADWMGIVRPITSSLNNYVEFERVLQDKIASIQLSEQRRYENMRAWQRNFFNLLLVLVLMVLTVATMLAWRTISHHSALLQETNRSLAEANQGLEEKVSARTQALAIANDEMTKLVEHLQATQKQLVQAEKLVALGGLVSGVAHELNTPIGNGLLMATTLSDLASEFETSLGKGMARSTFVKHAAQIKDCCALIEGSLQKAANIIVSFKFIAMDQRNERRQRFELAELLNAILVERHPYFQKARCDVQMRLPEGLALDSYPDSLTMVFNILIDNALTHAFDENSPGSIEIVAREMDQNMVEITFSDDGAGMDPQVLQRIFEPFFTTQMGQGTNGLGMTIAYNIVTGILGGYISVKMASPRGTIVEIVVPKVVLSS
ncbi:sensor histidine kinase [Solimicrobium silvestre]|uniref:histidine kinase n=1 Tax=Solimicrobium silvestre TaxID=2099400 RepID=A0A2S9GX58_9BURK|nr:ATP-binding protein [Solimicrobium silvestre]PRC92305.1 Histidine kinase-, DNA gyrase B-, and HSP90-like ATPase [Solimicrobium silvestre]